MNEELKSALEAMKVTLEGKSLEQAKAEIKAFETTNKELIKTEAKALFDAEIKTVKEGLEAKFAQDLKVVQDHADALDLKLQSNPTETKNVDPIGMVIKANTEGIKAIRPGAGFQTKAVANMVTGNLTGTAPRTFSFDIVKFPAQSVNIEDLARGVVADNGIYTYTRELPGEGSIAGNTEGTAKSQRDYDFIAIDVSTNFIAGFARYSKKMRNNLTYIVNSIPDLLRRDYYKAENAAFQLILAAQATASTQVITGNTKAEMLINEIGKLQDADYEDSNLIVVKPTDYLSILKTASKDLAAAVTYENGILRVAGVQVLKGSSWLPANKYYVGDWSRVSKITTEGLSLEFSETEGSNFVNNNITARIEAQVACEVEQPAALIYGDFTAV